MARNSSGGAVDELKVRQRQTPLADALDRQRMKVNQTENIDGMDFSGTSSVEDAIENDERIDSIRKAMDALPEKQRVAMQLRDFEGRSYKEIADIMEITEDQVKVNIFRARQTIRQLISAS